MNEAKKNPTKPPYPLLFKNIAKSTAIDIASLKKNESVEINFEKKKVILSANGKMAKQSALPATRDILTIISIVVTVLGIIATVVGWVMENGKRKKRVKYKEKKEVVYTYSDGSTKRETVTMEYYMNEEE